MLDLVKNKQTQPVIDKETVHLATGRILETELNADDSSENINDLVSRLRFAINDGRIWLDTQRVLLIHMSTMTSLRKELIDTLGVEKARGVLIRMGYASGIRDAVLARKLRPTHSARDAYLLGPQLRILQGISSSTPKTLEIDITSGHFFSEFIVNESFEADAHLSTYGVCHIQTCWLQIGYACGFSSTFMGRPVIHKEVECRSTGGRYCRFVGKLAEEWEDDSDDIHKILDAEFRKFGKYKQILDAKYPIENMAIPHCVSNVDIKDNNMVGKSAAFVATTHMIKKVAKTATTVLFLGETGVGKERFARSLHSASKRSNRPFIAMNCAAIPETLIEAELFGVQKGAFTGATETRIGKFEQADHGTLFLDEVGNLSKQAQLKLLRAIQEREFTRVGGTTLLNADVRIIAATNVDLQRAVNENKFRKDLFYRLNVFPVNVPPLRERRNDILLLMEYFLEKNSELHEKQNAGFTVQAIDALYHYSYPGNIRELENMVERAVILIDDEQSVDINHLFTNTDHLDDSSLRLDQNGALLTEAELSKSSNPTSLLETFIHSKSSLNDLEIDIINEAVKHSNGNIAQAARLLGLSRPQMAYRLKKANQ